MDADPTHDQTGGPATTAAGSSPPPPGPPRLNRSRDDKLVAGVCGGLGRHFGIDPIIFRIAFVALTLAGASGVVLYLLAWLLIPADGEPQARAVAMVRGREWSRPLAAALIVAGVVILLGDLRAHSGPPLAVAVVLAGLGVALYVSERDAAGPVTEPPGHAPPPPDPTSGPAPAVPPPAPPAPPPPARVPRSPLAPLTVSGLLVLAGVFLLVDRAGWADVSLVAFLAVALVVVGAALVVSAWWGRALALIPLGVVLTLALALASVVDVPLGDGMGERRFRPERPAQLRPVYRLAMGELVVDLRDALATAGRAEVEATVGLGRLVVLVPPDAGVVADGRVGVGQLVLFGRTEDGPTLRERTVRPPAREGAARLRLRVSAGMGEAVVRDATP